jgi:FMN phosphatase YigB (HAD superfamily)
MDFMVHGLIGLLAGLAAVVLWEALGLRDWALSKLRDRQARKVWRKFFALDGDVFIAQSPVQTQDAKQATRDADVRATDLIGPHILVKADRLRQDPGLTATHAAAHFVLIGSTKYSQRPRDLQNWYELPYQYVFQYIHDDPPRRVLKIVSSYGQEYTESLDVGRRAGRWPIDYGILFIAAVPERKRIYWISGIHGAGTIGVALHFAEHPEQFCVHDSAASWARQWLLRVEYDPKVPESKEMVKSVEVIAGPVNCELRDSRHNIRAIICDFGNVLMTFDRDRTYRALGHAYGRPYKEIEAALTKGNPRDRYERGELDDREFFNVVRETLGTDVPMDLEAFSEWWGDIFWENRDVAELFRELKEQVALVMLSNTNSLHIASVREHYPDLLNLFRGHILSFEEKRLKPAPELFHRAMAAAGSDVRPQECVYIDDKASFVEAAEKLGMLGHVYTSYPALVRALRTAGLRIT